jgi:hypothetical protein
MASAPAKPRPDLSQAIPSCRRWGMPTSKSSSGFAAPIRWQPSSIRSTTSVRVNTPRRSRPGSRTYKRNIRRTSRWCATSTSSMRMGRLKSCGWPYQEMSSGFYCADDVLENASPLVVIQLRPEVQIARCLSRAQPLDCAIVARNQLVSFFFEQTRLTSKAETVRFRPPSGYLDPWSFVSQGSGRAELSRTTRLGSQVASGGSPRPLRKEAD